MSTIPKPCDKSISKYLKEWDTLEKYTLQESSLGKLFHVHCPENSDIESVLLKVSALNDFYSTNIYDTYKVAKHILKLNIDAKLKSGDRTLVNDIASVNTGEKVRKFYSFASKYCSHHMPDEFPIYDSYVDKMLRYYRKVDKFSEFKNGDLKSYPAFISVIEALRDFYNVNSYTLRQLDIFLWLAGKQYLPNNYK
ncbi:hypothetical protein LZP73_07915 [Shewanella sp. AS16]|uniref:hypothetical protein n=1 Tax=Shewanella sp. AS16 TaxID=2907625 RepID=UPI001F4093C8|nr:hypothetical protein [Shewanella sp. AS16]MCE9686142.1 hypothetical protein [Shewanella sp. AS16]